MLLVGHRVCRVLPTITQLLMSDPLASKENWTSPSEEDYSYLANLIGRALEEKLSTLAHYTRRAYVALAIVGASRLDNLLFDQQCKAKQWIKESVHRLML